MRPRFQTETLPKFDSFHVSFVMQAEISASLTLDFSSSPSTGAATVLPNPRQTISGYCMRAVICLQS